MRLIYEAGTIGENNDNFEDASVITNGDTCIVKFHTGKNEFVSIENEKGEIQNLFENMTHEELDKIFYKESGFTFLEIKKLVKI